MRISYLHISTIIHIDSNIINLIFNNIHGLSLWEYDFVKNVFREDNIFKGFLGSVWLTNKQGNILSKIVIRLKNTGRSF